MAIQRTTISRVARALAAADMASLSDRDLLRRFASDNDQAAFAEIVTRLQTGEPVPQSLIDSLPVGIRVELPIEAGHADGSVTVGTVTIEEGRIMYHRLHDTSAPPDKLAH